LIAEIKRRSPSRGLLAPDFDPRRLARLYCENGAACISVLTDRRFFGGDLAHLIGVKSQAPEIPLLRKDFICDPYQLYQARAAGADAVLLIVAALAPAQLRELHALARTLGMAALIEVHADAELEVALAAAPALIGVNNRDLHTFTVDLGVAEQLAARIPADICVVAESGIHGPADLARLAAIPRPAGAVGVDAVLVGEALVAAADAAAKVRELAGGPACGL
jgi:indole-3-glycerol phosphate synthase